MNAGRLVGRDTAVDRRGVAILAGSAGLHIVVLTLIGLDMAARTDGFIAQDRPVVLDLEPWPALARQARPVATASPAAQPGQGAAEPLPSLPIPRQPSVVRPDPALPASPQTASSPQVAPPAAPPAASRADAVGAGLALPNAWRGDVCRDLSNFAAWQAARCGERGPAGRSETGRAEPRSARAAEPAIGQRRGDASERRRDEGFARQKAMNDRWLEYYRYRDAPYPGLRALPSQL